MSIKKYLIPLALVPAIASAADDGLVASFSMDVRQGQIVEQISGNRFGVQGHFSPENLPGAKGQALRFDGYTSFVDASLGNILPAGNKQMTFSIWAALPCYPIVQIDTNTPEMVAIASCLDEEKKTGFGFFVGFDGKYKFRAFADGWPVEVVINSPLPVYQWNNLVAVVDCDARSVTLYNNGEAVGAARCSGQISFAGGSFKIGHGDNLNYSGPFLLTSYNGLIDDIQIWNKAIPQSEIVQWKPENPANLDIPASRFANDVLRPRFHGMPAAGWTNECHGMTYSDGRYHLFFQKNADGPYMARLHWGHISSENLFDWREEPIAIAPGAAYDIKGCWSGCVFTDPVITGDRPAIIYTGVDYGRATIDGASPENNSLIKWNKWSNNPIINGRPGSLTDDFRDPYFFRNGDNAYIIVGSSRNGVGTTSLHRYDAGSKTWSNDGALFFSGSSAAADGVFWEMPNITKMPNCKWLFTATPLATSSGVRTIYWAGSINSDGSFNPDSNFPYGKNVELVAKEGYGLLSPTIYQHDGKTIVLGIVPDKLPSQDNWNLGWAHCYSLPREWSLADNGELQQKPFSGLQEMRSATSFSRSDFQLEGNVSLNPVSGREVEILGVFTIGNSPFGFKIFKNSSAEATVTYTPSTSSLKLDFSALRRLINDRGAFDGVYNIAMPEFLKRGSDLKINLFIDHSIIDVFINDRWATSIRVFPTDVDADGIEAFSTTGATTVKSLNAWTLKKSSDSAVSFVGAEKKENVSVYNLQGICIRKNISSSSDAVSDLPSGIYLVDGRKVLVP